MREKEKKRKQGIITYRHKASSRRPREPGRSAVHFRTFFFLRRESLFLGSETGGCDCCLRINHT